VKGSTQDKPLAEVVRDLHFDRADGILSITCGGVPSHVYFDRGTVFYCRSEQVDHRLDRVLVRWGLVPEAQVAGLLQRAGADVRGALVREGVFPDAASFDDFMARVLRERLLDVLGRAPASWEFAPQDVHELNTVTFKETTPNLVLEGARRLPDSAQALGPLQASRKPLTANARPPVRLESLRLSPSEGYVLSLVTGSATVADVASVSPLGDVETLRLLYGLLLLDVLQHPLSGGHRFSLAHLAERQQAEREKESAEEQRITAEYERVRSIDVLRFLPDLDGTDDERASQALRAYQEEWKPERFTPVVARRLRDRLLLIQARAGEALLARIEAGQRRRGGADAGRDQEDALGFKRMELSRSEAQSKAEADGRAAEEHVKRAQQAMRGKDYHAAVQLLQQALRLNETAEAQALLAECLAQNPRWAHRAEHAYRRAMELDAFDPNLPVALGRIYQRAGLKQRARECFERALEIQADCADAKAGLKELGRG